jgi:hypothetical protein
LAWPGFWQLFFGSGVIWSFFWICFFACQIAIFIIACRNRPCEVDYAWILVSGCWRVSFLGYCFGLCLTESNNVKMIPIGMLWVSIKFAVVIGALALSSLLLIWRSGNRCIEATTLPGILVPPLDLALLFAGYTAIFASWYY